MNKQPARLLTTNRARTRASRTFTPLITLAIIIALMLFMRFSAQASAADIVFVTDTTVDAVDINIGDGICATADGECALRAAVQEANAQAGTDTILLGAGVHQLSIAGKGENSGAAGDLDVTDGLLILGPEGGSTVSANWLDRVLHVSSGVELDLVNVTLTQGTAEGDSATDAGLGGALFGDVGSTINVTNSRMVQNRASSGGALFVRSGTVTIDGAIFAGNVATEIGGAVTLGQSTATISNSIFESNVAGSSGGGLYNAASSITMTGNQISSNAADVGGGIASITGASGGLLQISTTEIDSNNANEAGGGLWISGGATVISSSITRNGSAIGAGVAVVSDDAGDAGDAGDMVATFEEVLFDGNISSGAGGALWSDGALSVRRSVIGSNNAGSGGTDIHITGDATARAEIVNTFFQNRGPIDEVPIDEGPVEDEEILFGTSIHVETLGTAVLINNTMLGDFGTGTAFRGIVLVGGLLEMTNTIVGQYLVGMEYVGGEFVGDHNLFFANEVNGSGEVVFGPNTLLDVDPMLADEGDLLRQRSPATDVGDDAVCPAVDRQGQPRPKDGGGDLEAICDIGSYEIQFPVNDPPVAASDVITITRDDVISPDLPYVLPVLANDVDPNGDALMVISTTLPSHGEILFNDDGTISYLRAPNFNGTDVFTYTITDGRGETSSALAELLVIPGLTIGANVSFGDDWQIGDGTDIERNVVLGDEIRIGSGVVISKNVTVTHRAVLGDGVVLAESVSVGENAIVGSDSIVGKFTQIGAGATLGERVTTARHVTIGENSVLGDDVSIARETVIGRDVLIEPMVTILKVVTIGDGTHLGAGVLVEEDAVLGADVSVGANTRVAESVVIAESAQIGADVTLLDQTTVGVAATIADRVQTGKRVTIADRAQIGEDVIIEKDSQIGAAANIDALVVIKAETQVGDAVRIGANAWIGKRTRIGNESIIGEAAFVSNDVTLGASVQLGANSKLGNHVTIGADSVLADMVNVDHYGAIGERVQIGTESEVRKNSAVGSDSVLATFVVIERDAQVGERVQIGDGGRVRTGETVPDETVIPGDLAEVEVASVRARRSAGSGYVQLIPMIVESGE